MKQNEILEMLSLSPKTESAVKTVFTKKNLDEIIKTAYLGETLDYPLLRRKPLTRLAAVIALLSKKYEDYKSLGASEEIIAETFRDVALRANLYYERTGKPGISKEDTLWFRHIINSEIFKIGALQFQPFEMIYLDEEFLGEPYMNFSKTQKEELPSGAQVINCHIPSGADLSTEAVKESFIRAQTFFGEVYPNIEFKAFLCYSWLLYPEMINLLPKSSKIKAFAKNFEIIGKFQDNEQAFENLFGKAYKRPPKIKNATNLQKLAAEKPKAFGFACGIKYL
ncbi:MAG: DUF5596 domain-containing protein [Oscillospiraceae bacterium]|nr:DUF5596 domain-containing protein [Oscillospiraceae bacterium]